MTDDLSLLKKFIVTTIENWIFKQGYVKRVSGKVTSYNGGTKIAQVMVAGDTISVPIKNLTNQTLVTNDLVYIDIQNNNMTNAFISFKR